jgi:hypothetical protein
VQNHWTEFDVKVRANARWSYADVAFVPTPTPWQQQEGDRLNKYDVGLVLRDITFI